MKRAPSKPLLAALVVVAALAALLFAGWRMRTHVAVAPPAGDAEIVASAPGWVDVLGGTYHIAADSDARVRSIDASEGDTVDAGAVLIRLDDSETRLARDIAAVELQTRAHDLDTLTQRVAPLRSRLTRLEPLVAQQAAPADELRDGRDKLAELQAQIAAARLAVRNAELQLRQIDERLARLVVRAPKRGQVLRLTVHPGDSVARGAEMVWFAPDAPLIVRAELDERLFNTVKTGMAAIVSPEYDETQSFDAHVARIARSVGPVRSLPEVRSGEKDDRVVELLLTLDPSTLLIGQRVIVSIRTR
jgi:multidrug resistance efflux pump